MRRAGLRWTRCGPVYRILARLGGILQLTPDEHRKRHWELHQALDELLADYFTHHPRKHTRNTTLAELMVWAYEQTSVPTEVPEI